MIQEAINRLAEGGDITFEETKSVAGEIMSGDATPIQVGAFLTALRIHGEQKHHLLAFARVMKEKVIPISAPENQVIIDTCGTGGDRRGTFNISTAAAFIIAGAGVLVAKHGNRSVSSTCGSADVLEELRVNIQPPKEIVERCLKEIGIAFIFAPMCHRAMKHAAQPRREIGIRTIFNMVGPIVNPSNITHHVLGVFSKDMLQTYGEVLRDLGLKGAIIAHSDDGLDEITTTSRTNIVEFKSDGVLRSYTIEPEDFGFRRIVLADIKGKDKETNAAIMESVLRGAPGSYLDVCLFNAGFGIYITGKTDTIQNGIEMAQESVRSGSAMAKLDALRELSHAADNEGHASQ